MRYKLIIEGRLPGLNEYIAAERAQRHAAARLKRETQELVSWYVRAQLGSQVASKPVQMHYLWVEPGRRRDLDNIAFAKKFVQDALVQMGFLQGDGWRHVVGFTDSFAVDEDRPRVEVTIIETEDEIDGENQGRHRGRSYQRGEKAGCREGKAHERESAQGSQQTAQPHGAGSTADPVCDG